MTRNSLQFLIFAFSLILLGNIADAKESTNELLKGASIINKQYPQTHYSGRYRVDKVTVYDQTLRFHYTSFMSKPISEQKIIFWADAITRAKSPTMTKLIRSQGSVRYRYTDTRGNYLFEFVVTPKDLVRF